MQAEIRRIDLRAEPVIYETWPRLEPAAAPVGRSGLWDAMANAVRRAREASLDGGLDQRPEVPVVPSGTPHLQYLARVAAAGSTGAEVIALDDRRRA